MNEYTTVHSRRDRNTREVFVMLVNFKTARDLWQQWMFGHREEVPEGSRVAMGQDNTGNKKK